MFVRDPGIEGVYAHTLRSRGFTVDLARPMRQTPSVVETVARSGGKIDAIVLAHHGSMSSSSSNPLVVARATRQLSEDLSFMGAVRARTVPIVVVAGPSAFGSADDVEWLNLLTPDVCDGHPETLITRVFGVVSGWRQSLLQELE